MNSGRMDDELDENQEVFMERMQTLMKENPETFEILMEFQETLRAKGKLDLSNISMFQDEEKMEHLQGQWAEDPVLAKQMEAIRVALEKRPAPIEKLEDMKQSMKSIIGNLKDGEKKEDGNETKSE